MKAFSLTSEGVLHIQFILFVIRMSKRKALFGEHLSLFQPSENEMVYGFHNLIYSITC